MEKNSNDIPVKEQGIVTIYLPPLSSGDLFEIHAAIKTVVSGLPAYKMDFRILGEKGGGGLVNPAEMPRPDNDKT